MHARQGQVIVLHAGGGDEQLGLADLFRGRIGDEQDGCDMRRVPAHVVDEVAKRMAWRIRELLDNARPENGRIEHFDGDARTWKMFAAPTA